MTEATYEAIKEKLNLINPTLNAIEFGGEEPYLRELQTILRKNLASLLSLFERNPGLDAATTDLYAAAAAIVSDVGKGSQPLAKKRRLLRDAQARFEERILLACPSGRKASAEWTREELFLAA